MRSISPPAVFLVLASCACYAHQDSVIEIKNDGTLVGLPSQFLPSILKIQFNSKENTKHPIESVSLTIGNRILILPKKVVSLLRSKNLSSVSVTSSWYHEPSLLPPYLIIEFQDSNFLKDQKGISGYRMMFNLNTCKLISLASIFVIEPDSSWQHRPMDLSTLFTPSELAQIYAPIKFK